MPVERLFPISNYPISICVRMGSRNGCCLLSSGAPRRLTRTGTSPLELSAKSNGHLDRPSRALGALLDNNAVEDARAARRFAIVLDLLATGDLTLTAITLLSPHLSQANHADVLEGARHKSNRDVEHIVARVRPRPDVPATRNPRDADLADPADPVSPGGLSVDCYQRRSHAGRGRRADGVRVSDRKHTTIPTVLAIWHSYPIRPRGARSTCRCLCLGSHIRVICVP